MTSFWVLLLLFIILILSVLGSTYAHYKQQAQKDKQLKLQSLRRSAEFYNEVAGAIAPMTANKDLPFELTKVTISYYEHILKLDPSAEFASHAIENANTFANMLTEDTTGAARDLYHTDAEIAKAQKHFNNAEKIFRQLKNRGELSLKQFEEFHNELIWLYFKSDIDLLTKHGQMALERGNRHNALSYYQKAQNKIKKSAIQDPRKDEMLAEVAEFIEKNRTKVKPSTSNEAEHLSTSSEAENKAS